MINKTTLKRIILVFTILYILGFGIYYLIAENYEFLWYIAILVVLTLLTITLNKKYNFNPILLFGVSIWGLMHMAGGSIFIYGKNLYSLILFPIFSSNITGTDLFRYDQFAHFYFHFVVTFLIYIILKNYLNKNYDKSIISIFLLLVIMGIGALNEIIELTAVLIVKDTGVGDYFNNAWDLVFNTLGAILAIVIINLKKK